MAADYCKPFQSKDYIMYLKPEACYFSEVIPFLQFGLYLFVFSRFTIDFTSLYFDGNLKNKGE